MSNRALARRLFAHGGLDQAERGKVGVRRTKIRIEKDSFSWKPAESLTTCKSSPRNSSTFLMPFAPPPFRP